jgi:hypothetical protein
MNMFAYPVVTQLAALAATDMTFGDRIGYSVRMLVVGMLMVFSVLTLLWGVLAIFKYFFYDIPKRNKETATHNAEEALEHIAPVVPVAPAAPEPVTPPVADDAAIVAAITAAIAATLAEEGYTGGFRVVSFRKL